MQKTRMTISQFAKAGNVGVETVRFYQRRGLLPIPAAGETSYREYDDDLVQQLRFIRRAQLAGFTLAEIKELLALHPVTDRLRIQSLAKNRLEKLNVQIAQLREVSHALKHLLQHCEQSEEGIHCPIVKAFV